MVSDSSIAYLQVDPYLKNSSQNKNLNYIRKHQNLHNKTDKIQRKKTIDCKVDSRH